MVRHLGDYLTRLRNVLTSRLQSKANKATYDASPQACDAISRKEEVLLNRYISIPFVVA